MKDKWAREELKYLEKDVEVRLTRLSKQIDELRIRGEIFVKFCKKCKHDTAQTIETHGSITVTSYFTNSFDDELDEPVVVKETTRCLNCGTLWECEEKTVCREVKERR